MAPASHILIVDDDDQLRKVLGEALSLEGHKVAEANGREQALEILKDHVFQLVISDLRMPESGEGLELLAYLQEYSPHTEVIIMTGFGTVDNAVEAMRAIANMPPAKAVSTKSERAAQGAKKQPRAPRALTSPAPTAPNR